MYRKIDIHVGPTIASARLETRKICTCGMNAIKSDTPIGTRYDVDLKSVRWVKYVCSGCGKEHTMRVIDVWNELLIPKWFPLGCLDIDAAIPYAPIPDKWAKVKDNLVAPAHYIPGVKIDA